MNNHARLLVGCVVIGVVSGLFIGRYGCRARNDALTIRKSPCPVIYEGLPHPVDEPEVFREERKKPTIEFGAWPFYRDPLDLGDADTAALVETLGDRATYSTYIGEKKCGGFHPDFVVEWTHEGTTYQSFLCFGCGEIRVEGAGLLWMFDVPAAVRPRLKSILQKHRKNRPAPRVRSALDYP